MGDTGGRGRWPLAWTLALGASAAAAGALFPVGQALVERCKDGCGFAPADYASLYFPEELPRIEGFERRGSEELGLQLSPSPAQAWIIEDDAGGRYRVQGTQPSLRLLPGIHSYQLTADAAGDVPPFEMQLTVSHAGDEHVVTNASIPIGRFRRYPLARLTMRVEDFPVQDVRRAERLLQEAGVRDDQPSWVRMEKIASFLLKDLDTRRGRPPPEAARMSPMQQYDAALAGDIEIWCGNFAAIYGFFATVAGVPTRLLTTKASFDGVTLNGHSFAESYVAERHSWAYVDLTFRTAHIRNAGGDFLNAVQVVRALHAAADGGLVATRIEDGQIVQGRDRDDERFMRMHLDANGTLIFHWPYRDRHSVWSRLHRYAWQPELAHAALSWRAPKVPDWLVGLAAALLGLALGLGIYGFYERRRWPA